jgi:hypothetical protein
MMKTLLAIAGVVVLCAGVARADIPPHSHGPVRPAVTLPGLTGHFVQLSRKPNLRGLKESSKITGVDGGVEVWKKGSSVQYARELVDGGVMKTPYFKKVSDR